MAKRRLRASARLIGEIVGRKRAEDERERLQAQLAQAQKMESVGRLAGGVAHDFNNMLQAILGNVDLALQDIPPDSPARESLEEIRKSAARSADLTRQLLAFARKQTIVPVVLNLNDTVAGLAKMLRRLIGEEIELSWSLGAELWLGQPRPHPGRPGARQPQRQRARRHRRARVASPSRPATSCWTRRRSRRTRSALPGDYVMLAVSDTGVGMDADTLAHMFEPFFTTKAVGTGTGPRARDRLRDRQAERGTDPASRANRAEERSSGSTSRELLGPWPRRPLRRSPSPGGTETILLVEDEDQILQLGRRILERRGYTVLVAATPDEALAVAAAHGTRIDLLITDVVMPGMNGRALRDRLRTTCPDMKCLFISGYTADVIAHHGVLEDGVLFLQKPFAIQALAQMVRTALD